MPQGTPVKHKKKTKSVLKNIRQTERRTAFNRMNRTRVRTAMRKMRAALTAGDSAEAAKFLWKAVGKENPSAILLLSDMYLVGDGVPKSCDQARLLLNAAVRKNVPHAAMKLRNLQTAGCP